MFDHYQAGSACLIGDEWRKMSSMETPTSQTEEQLGLLDYRLTAVERNLAALTTEVAVLSKTAATKEDLAKLEGGLRSEIARIDATLANCATKADLYKLETRITKWMVATLVGVAALNSTLVLIVAKLVQP